MAHQACVEMLKAFKEILGNGWRATELLVGDPWVEETRLAFIFVV